MARSFCPSKVLLALCLAALARGPASAADPDKVDAAKRFLSNPDRAKGVLFFAHPTATYNRVHVAKVSDVVDGVLFLESSPYITGEILHIDGGQIAGHSEPLG